MEKPGLILLSFSPFKSSIVIVSKKDQGDIQITVNYRRMNKFLVDQEYKLSRMLHIFHVFLAYTQTLIFSTWCYQISI